MLFGKKTCVKPIRRFDIVTGIKGIVKGIKDLDKRTRL